MNDALPASATDTVGRGRAPVIAFEELHAVDRAGARGRPRGRLLGVDVMLPAGVHAFVGAPEDGSIALVDAFTGAHRPLRGSLRVSGRQPYDSPSIRARIGTLTYDEMLPDAATVGGAVGLAMRARGEPAHRFDAVLDAFGLSALHGRLPRSLSIAELRAVALALALTTPAPRAIALYEPIAEVAVGTPEIVRRRIRELASSGAAVLVVTSSWTDARALTDRVYVMQRGQVMGPLADTTRDAGGAELVAIVSAARDDSGVRVLISLLAQRAEISALTWERATASSGGSPQPNGDAYAVRIRGGDLDACALALAATAEQAGVRIESIAPMPPRAVPLGRSAAAPRPFGAPSAPGGRSG